MSSNLKNFIVLLPSGHRQSMKVQWDTSILQILEDVCKKNGLKAEEFDLKHHNTVLDASTVIRYSALPNNAFLEMVPCREQRKVSAVTVSVQSDSNPERLTGDFMPKDALEIILQKLCPEILEDKSKVPVVVFMRREIVGCNKISSTTLQELGVTSGRILLRVTTRDSEKHPELQLIGSAMLKPVEPKNVKEEVAKSSVADVDKSSVNQSIQEQQSSTAERVTPSNKFVDVSSNKLLENRNAEEKTPVPEKKVEEPTQKLSRNMEHTGSDKKVKEDITTRKVVNNGCSTASNIDSFPLKDIDLSGIKYIDENRKILIFHLKDENSTTEELPEDFFDVTLDDVRLMLRDLKRTREEMENTPLLTGTLRESQSQRKVEQYSETVIRVQFPDRHVLQGVFKPNDLFADVIQCVKQSLSHPETDFYLYTSPPKRILLPEETLFSADCVPCAKIYFGTSITDDLTRNASYIKETLHPLIISRSLATIAACQSRNIRPNTSLRREATEDSVAASGQACSSGQQATKTDPPTFSSSEQLSSRKMFKSKDETVSKEKVPKWFKPL
ncbi:hypothetical protein LSTR_LSTR010129 [Laodelphax striatellus]|uniref:UBX domain-containing protein n=1 Tax=Laodelphax striatellus TaxID=195883 RepID=A0A482WJ04_LAOST|nr:hypothetical protein LSTR_LSTR010129 [Laodelphax striatellus]